MSDPFWQGGGCVCGHKGQNSQNSLFVGYLFAPYIVITHKGPSLIGRYIKAKKLGFWIGHFIVYSSVLTAAINNDDGAHYVLQLFFWNLDLLIITDPIPNLCPLVLTSSPGQDTSRCQL